jgi:hypothetical protein
VIADIRDPLSVRKALGKPEFDVVVNWVAFTPEHIQIDIDLLGGRTGQYVFISSTSAYQTPPARLPIRESTPLHTSTGCTAATRSPVRKSCSLRIAIAAFR